MSEYFKILDIDSLAGEEWVDCVFINSDGLKYDYTGYYQVSSFGRVKALERKLNRKPLESFKGGNSQKRNASILKQRISNTGRLIVTFCKNGETKQWQVSRLVGYMFIPNPDNKPEINHLKGFQNNHKDFLEWATKKENDDHAKLNNLKPKGEMVHFCKLTNKKVLSIFKSNLTQVQLSKKYKVHQTTISLIKTGKKWGWLTGKKYEKGLVDSISENSSKAA